MVNSPSAYDHIYLSSNKLCFFTSLQKTTKYFCPICSSADRYESFEGLTCPPGQEKYSPSLTQKIDVELFVSNIGTYLQTTLSRQVGMKSITQLLFN